MTEAPCYETDRSVAKSLSQSFTGRTGVAILGTDQGETLKLIARQAVILNGGKIDQPWRPEICEFCEIKSLPFLPLRKVESTSHA